MAKGFFITGTDTGVGKTVIAAAIIKAINFLGIRACGMKPIETGCSREGDILMPADGMFLKRIAHMDENIDKITPCCFEHPLAPMVASEIEGISVDVNKIKRAFNDLTKTYQTIVVEGAGGILVPISRGGPPGRPYYMIDLAQELGLPLIVVARPGLGMINHTLLTVNYAIKEGLEVAGIIINYSQPPEGTIAEETNPQTIKELSPVPLIGIFPHLKDIEDETIEKTALKNLNLDFLKPF